MVAPDPRRLRPEGLGYLGLVKLVALDRWTEPCLDKAMHLSRARMALEGRLREEQLSIEPDLEPAPTAGQQRRPGDPWRPPVEEFSHRTGDSIGVVSDDAELDLELDALDT